MNFLDFNGKVEPNSGQINIGEHLIDIPKSRDGANGELSLGVRPEHIKFDDSSNYKGEVSAVEYLGTTQIITLQTPNGIIKSRMLPTNTLRMAKKIGLSFDARTLTMFDNADGRA